MYYSYVRHLRFDFFLPLLFYLVPDLLEGEGRDNLGVQADLNDTIVLLIAETAAITSGNLWLLVTPL